MCVRACVCLRARDWESGRGGVRTLACERIGKRKFYCAGVRLRAECVVKIKVRHLYIVFHILLNSGSRLEIPTERPKA